MVEIGVSWGLLLNSFIRFVLEELFRRTLVFYGHLIFWCFFLNSCVRLGFHLLSFLILNLICHLTFFTRWKIFWILVLFQTGGWIILNANLFIFNSLTSLNQSPLCLLELFSLILAGSILERIITTAILLIVFVVVWRREKFNILAWLFFAYSSR